MTATAVGGESAAPISRVVYPSLPERAGRIDMPAEFSEIRAAVFPQTQCMLAGQGHGARLATAAPQLVSSRHGTARHGTAGALYISWHSSLGITRPSSVVAAQPGTGHPKAARRTGGKRVQSAPTLPLLGSRRRRARGDKAGAASGERTRRGGVKNNRRQWKGGRESGDEGARQHTGWGQ